MIGLADARQKRLDAKRMLADGIDPVESMRKAKTEDAGNGRTFESVALDWHKNMSARWTPDQPPTFTRQSLLKSVDAITTI
ncbi:hypothetical protein BK662_12835 [Pseudomonas frederiksbergensis]|uniref:Integrase n=1 Tax=Pseudomonas frederiksbergensis TaxID=104087 RepID=A0A423HR07_9PSED|nr:hypothetical protein BK662_12835 [Pseudomonas frederiksbergensis]